MVKGNTKNANTEILGVATNAFAIRKGVIKCSKNGK